jgi:hypothetical protein
MCPTVVDNKHTAWARVGIHEMEQTFKPKDEVVAIVISCLDMAVENSVKG